MAAQTKPTTSREKRKRYQRVTAKQYRWTQFTVPELFGDDPFELPRLSHMSNGVVDRLNQGDFAPFYEWLESAHVDAEALEAMRTLDADEFTEFQKHWADGVDIPKS